MSDESKGSGGSGGAADRLRRGSGNEFPAGSSFDPRNSKLTFDSVASVTTPDLLVCYICEVAYEQDADEWSYCPVCSADLVEVDRA